MRLIYGLVLPFLFFSFAAKAYVPSVKGLSQLVVAKQAKAIYKIKQKIYFSDNKYTLYETWYVKNNTLKLQSSYNNTFSIYSFKKKQVWTKSKYFISKVGPYFYQRFFLNRNSKDFLKDLKQLGLNKDKSFSHIVRYLGRPHYIINNLSNVSQSNSPTKYAPNIIIDNLSFYIKQILFKTNIFVQSSNYKRYKKNFYFPKNIQIFFNKSVINISTTSIKSISAYQFNKIKYKKTSKITKDAFSDINYKNLLQFLKYFR